MRPTHWHPFLSSFQLPFFPDLELLQALIFFTGRVILLSTTRGEREASPAMVLTFFSTDQNPTDITPVHRTCRILVSREGDLGAQGVKNPHRPPSPSSSLHNQCQPPTIFGLVFARLCERMNTGKDHLTRLFASYFLVSHSRFLYPDTHAELLVIDVSTWSLLHRYLRLGYD